MPHIALDFQIVEQRTEIVHDVFVFREQTYVRIHAGGTLVEVARTHIGKRFRFSVFVLAQHQSHFGMNLQSRNAVHYVYAGLLHLFGRIEIVGFVKTGFQFHKHSDFLAVARCRNERVYHTRIFRHAILRDENLLCRLIVRRLCKEVQEYVERMIGAEHEEVFPRQISEHRALLFKHRRHERLRLAARSIGQSRIGQA